VATSKDVENQEMLETVNTEEIGTLEILQQTEASQSVTEGKGIPERFVALKLGLGLGLVLGLGLGSGLGLGLVSGLRSRLGSWLVSRDWSLVSIRDA